MINPFKYFKRWGWVFATILYGAIALPFGIGVISGLVGLPERRYIFIFDHLGIERAKKHQVIFIDQISALIPHSDSIFMTCIEFDEPLTWLPNGFEIMPDKEELREYRIDIRLMENCIPIEARPAFRLLNTRSGDGNIYGSDSIFYNSLSKRAFYLSIN